MCWKNNFQHVNYLKLLLMFCLFELCDPNIIYLSASVCRLHPATNVYIYFDCNSEMLFGAACAAWRAVFLLCNIWCNEQWNWSRIQHPRCAGQWCGWVTTEVYEVNHYLFLGRSSICQILKKAALSVREGHRGHLEVEQVEMGNWTRLCKRLSSKRLHSFWNKVGGEFVHHHQNKPTFLHSTSSTLIYFRFSFSCWKLKRGIEALDLIRSCRQIILKSRSEDCCLCFPHHWRERSPLLYSSRPSKFFNGCNATRFSHVLAEQTVAQQETNHLGFATHGTAREQEHLSENRWLKQPLDTTVGNGARSGIHTDILLLGRFMTIPHYRASTRRHAQPSDAFVSFLLNQTPRLRLTAHASATFTAACGRTMLGVCSSRRRLRWASMKGWSGEVNSCLLGGKLKIATPADGISPKKSRSSLIPLKSAQHQPESGRIS